MERIAFILGDRFIYWSSILVTLAALAAIFLFLSLYLKKSSTPAAGFCVVPIAVALSLVLGRLIHWYCSAESYPGFLPAMTNLFSGSFALLGVFAGCLLAAVICRGVGLHRNLPQMLDCMCVAGGAGIAVGRLSYLFHSGDRGQLMKSLRTLPFACPTVNVVSGATEYRLATFFLQALVAGFLALLFAVFYLRRRRRPVKDGDTALLFLLCYGASQILLDSTRYDSLYFRSNGFVSVVQVMGALVLVLAIVVFSVRLVKNQGCSVWCVVRWVMMLALIGCAGYMEYHVQRHGDEALFAYSVMGTCLLLVTVLTARIRSMAEIRGKYHRRNRVRTIRDAETAE